MRLNLDAWQGNREIVAKTIGELLHDYPNELRLQVILDGFYSMQLHVDRLILQLRSNLNQEKLSSSTKEATKIIIADVMTFRGRE